jgi:hypothetical protein
MVIEDASASPSPGKGAELRAATTARAADYDQQASAIRGASA